MKSSVSCKVVDHDRFEWIETTTGAKQSLIVISIEYFHELSLMFSLIGGGRAFILETGLLSFLGMAHGPICV